MCVVHAYVRVCACVEMRVCARVCGRVCRRLCGCVLADVRGACRCVGCAELVERFGTCKHRICEVCTRTHTQPYPNISHIENCSGDCVSRHMWTSDSVQVEQLFMFVRKKVLVCLFVRVRARVLSCLYSCLNCACFAHTSNILRTQPTHTDLRTHNHNHRTRTNTHLRHYVYHVPLSVQGPRKKLKSPVT